MTYLAISLCFPLFENFNDLLFASCASRLLHLNYQRETLPHTETTQHQQGSVLASHCGCRVGGEKR